MHLPLTLTLATLTSALSSADFDWSSISPSRNLTFHPCYTSTTYQCARLQLPLNWSNTSDPRIATIAVIKLPANLPQSDKTHGGSIIVNPGGPGNAGVDVLLAQGDQIQELVTKPGKRTYDILSFDPRGVGLSTPASDCFGNDSIARAAYRYEQRGAGSLDSIPNGARDISYAMAVNDGYASHCMTQEQEGNAAFEFVGSPSVARDMVAMVDELDKLRKQEIGHQLTNSTDVPRLQYLGFSYGSALGNYFASLFPGRVGRMVLDGTLDAFDYSNGDGWLTNTVDTDEIYANFITQCHAQGPSACALAHPSDHSASNIESRISSLLTRLDESPISVTTSDMSVVISAADIKSLIFSGLYSPNLSFKPMAEILNEATQGNFSAVAGGIISRIQSELKAISEPGSAIICIDGGDVNNKTAKSWQEYSDKQVKQSFIAGLSVSGTRFQCSRWPFKSAYDFKGPFKSPVPVSKPHTVAGHPAAPILFLSNRLDPITPLRSARAMQKGHPESRIVIQEAMGHTTLAYGATSECTVAAVREYFDSGEVPKDKETSCKTFCGPWDPQGCPPTN